MDHKHLEQSELKDPGRRRFTRGGLAVPVVLGSLASRPVLAGPHNCAVSNAGSVNLSHGGELTDCSAFGSPTATFLALSVWPLPLVRGELTENDPTRKAKSGTEFNGCAIGGASNYNLSAVFTSSEFSRRGGSRLNSCFKTQDGKAAATMLQVLMNATSNSANGALGVATVTSLLNALSRLGTYPVGVNQIIAMFNAVEGGGTYMVSGEIPWNRSKVIEYFQSLYA